MRCIRMGLVPGLLLALALGLAVGACGGGGDKNNGVASLDGGTATTTTTGAGAGGDRRQRALAYARCMRQHGINIADPKPGEGINVDASHGANPEDPKFKAADQACQQDQPKGGDKQEPSNPAGGGG